MFKVDNRYNQFVYVAESNQIRGVYLSFKIANRENEKDQNEEINSIKIRCLLLSMDNDNQKHTIICMPKEHIILQKDM